GAIAIETAAASTLMVIRECDAAGELTEALTGVIALNNVFCLIAFSVVATGIELGRRFSQAGGGFADIYAAGYPLVWQLLGSAALGFLIGTLLAVWASHIKEEGETLSLMAGAVLLCVGVSQWMELSPLIASLAVGATTVNLSGASRRLFAALSHT